MQAPPLKKCMDHQQPKLKGMTTLLFKLLQFVYSKLYRVAPLVANPLPAYSTTDTDRPHFFWMQLRLRLYVKTIVGGENWQMRSKETQRRNL